MLENSKPQTEVIVALGANKGDPQSQIAQAFRELERLTEGELRRSSLWHSEAFGMNDNSSNFINAAAAFKTKMEPLDLLHELQGIEIKMGRPSDHGKNVARTIDLDLLLYGSNQIETEELIVPHPRMLERLFVLMPLQELMPDFVSARGQVITEIIDEAPKILISRV